MMTFAWITPINVTQVIVALLQLDSEQLQEKYRPDAMGFGDQLRHALDNYRYPESVPQGAKKNHSIDHIEAVLIRLLAEVNAFVHLLRPHAKQAWEEQFRVIGV